MQRLLGNSHASGEAQLPATAEHPQAPNYTSWRWGGTRKYFVLPHNSCFSHLLKGESCLSEGLSPFQQTFPIPKHEPPYQWFLQRFQLGNRRLICLVNFQLYHSSAVLCWSPHSSSDRIFDANFDSLEGFTAPGEVHWQDSTQLKWAPKQGCVYRHKAVGAESWGRAGKHCTNSCSNMPQGYMKSHILSGFFACKWFMGTRMLLYCLFKTHCNSSGYFPENQQ